MTRKRRQAKLKALARHEAGHAVAYAAFGAKPEIHMSYHVIAGVTGVRGRANITKTQRAVVDLAGLAAERIHKKNPGVVMTLNGPPPCLSGETGDLANLLKIAPRRKEEEFLNRHLREAWLLLQRNQRVLFELAEYISYANNKKARLEECSAHLDDVVFVLSSGELLYDRCRVFEFKELRRILAKVKAG